MSASLWQIDSGRVQQVAQVGSTLALPPGMEQSVFGQALRSPKLSVVGPFGSDAHSRLGYAFAARRGSLTYLAYAESALPAGRRQQVAAGSPFAGLRFALYLGDRATPGALLQTDSSRTPIAGRTARVTVPFGADELLLVAATRQHLGGSLSASLWWIIALGGAVLSLAAAGTTERLVRRRRSAEQLADRVQELLDQQRNVAHSLQHALLPQQLPTIEGMMLAVRYVPGETGVEIGGDWYDVMALSREQVFFVIGDVSGHGIDAGTVMASLRFAVRAFVSEGHPPQVVLDKIDRLLDVVQDRHFATVICGVLDVERRRLTLANAGHLPLLVLEDYSAQYFEGSVGTPVGTGGTRSYRSASIQLGAGATVLAYTDGLIERRSEDLAIGMARLRDAALAGKADDLDDLLNSILTTVPGTTHDDDRAILGFRLPLAASNSATSTDSADGNRTPSTVAPA